jgi:hypothetical protein
MGASIFWQTVNGKSITPSLRSKFVTALRLEGQGRVLGEGDVEFLKGLAAGEGDFRDAIEELIEAIYTHGAVRVWAEY